MRGSAHPDDLKAKVIALLLSGGTVKEVCEQLDLPQQTVSTYKSQIPSDKFVELRLKKGERLDDLVYQCLVQNLQTLNKQAEIVSDEEYVRKQPAGEMATLYGVMADKTVRLLEVTTHPAARQQLEAGDSSNG